MSSEDGDFVVRGSYGAGDVGGVGEGGTCGEREKCFGRKRFQGRLCLSFVEKLELIEEVDRFI